MGTRLNLATFRSSLSAALGLAALACGQSTLDGADAGDNAASGSGGTGDVTGGAGGAGGGPIDLNCRNPMPLLGHDGSDTGFVRCDGGFVHRPERRTCASKLPRSETVDPGAATVVNCTTDADCASLPYGHCEMTTAFFPGKRVQCLSGCVEDADCAANQICLCGDPVGTCVQATCKSDAECNGLLCTADPRIESCTTGTLAGHFACQTPNDTCRADGDCMLPDTCSLGREGRSCQFPGACGRPFLVAGEARVAGVVKADTGWARETKPCVAELDRTARAELGEHYARLGAMEHASVAAFARFTLDLLSLGAPAELVAAAQRALGDEIRHAELCFGLASAYAGRALGPGPLSSDGALEPALVEAIIETAFEEACIGETLAAVEAAEAAERATDPAVRHALSGIAEDELRHAELGWRFISWALERRSAAERARLERRLFEAIGRAQSKLRVRSSSGRSMDARLVAHGLLTEELRGDAHRAALEQVVMPIARGISAARAA